MLNEVTLIGNVGKDPETFTTKNGKTMAKVAVATTKKWKDKDGNKQERSEWHSVVFMSEGFAKVVQAYVKKGSKVYIKGELATRKWQDKDGADRYTTEIIVSDNSHQLILLDSKPQGDTGQARPQQQRQQPKPQAHEGLDDTIPF